MYIYICISKYTLELVTDPSTTTTVSQTPAQLHDSFPFFYLQGCTTSNPNLPRSFVLELAALIWHSRVLEAHSRVHSDV
jgi:hypothetical protein